MAIGKMYEKITSGLGLLLTLIGGFIAISTFIVLANDTANDAETLALANDSRLDVIERHLIAKEEQDKSRFDKIEIKIDRLTGDLGQMRTEQFNRNKLTEYQTERINRLLDKLEE